jgi:hypothetical protein
METSGERVCSNCGEGCSEQDLAIDGWCAQCDGARADELKAQAELMDAEPAMVCSYDEVRFHGDRDFADLDGVRW